MHKGTCFLCLAVGRRIFDIVDTHLLPVYEKITDFKIQSDNHHLCFICHARVQQCYKLWLLAKQTQELLKSFQDNKVEKSIESHKSLVQLSTCNVVDIAILSSGVVMVDGEAVEVKEELSIDLELQDNEDTTDFSDKSNPAAVDAGDLEETGVHQQEQQKNNSEQREKIQMNKISHNFRDLSLKKCNTDVSNSINNNENSATRNSEGSEESRHVKSVPDDVTAETFACKYCQFVSVRKESVSLHEKAHRGAARFWCSVCDRDFSHKGNYTRHVRTHTGEKPYSCDVCKNRFAQLSTLNAHKIIHTGEKPFSCDICKQKFVRYSVLQRHQIVHTRDKLFTCQICKHSFSRKSYLIDHERTHLGEKPYGCEICCRSFFRKSDLNQHKRIHTKHKPYSCDYCERKFSHRTSLINHHRVHTGDKPHKCQTCKRRFKQRSNLMRHAKLHTQETQVL